MEIVVGVAGEGQRREAVCFDGNAEFFLKLTDERVLRPFASVNLPAGELPQALKRLAFGPLRQQHASVGVNQRRRDHEHELHEPLRSGLSAQRSASSWGAMRSIASRRMVQSAAPELQAGASFETRRLRRRSSERGRAKESRLTSDSRR